MSARANPAAPVALAVCIVCAISALLWALWPGLHGPFVFDDHQSVLNQPRAASLAGWWAGMPGIRPLLKLGFALQNEAGHPAWAFRLVNWACHLTCAVLVALICAEAGKQLTSSATRRWAGAVAAATGFALHPAGTEVAQYISARSVGAMAVFYLASLYLWQRAGPAGSVGWSLLAMAAALAVRETALTLPAALLLLMLAATGTAYRNWWRRTRWHWALAGLALLAALALPRYRELLDFSLTLRSPAEQWQTLLAAQQHLLLLLAGFAAPDIDPRISPLSQGATLLASLAWLLTAAAAWRWRATWPWPGFALAWWWLQLLPAQGLVPRLDTVADRHAYLAWAGLSWAGALVLLQVWSRLPQAWTRPMMLATAVVFTALCVRWALQSHARSTDYASEAALWTTSTRLNPDNGRAWNNLGLALAETEQTQAACQALHHAQNAGLASERAFFNALALCVPAPEPHPAPVPAP